MSSFAFARTRWTSRRTNGKTGEEGRQEGKEGQEKKGAKKDEMKKDEMK